ncbi:hypothetical protein [Geobacter argillaceus]|nr:hypothetical protein [Geobacter argillaceus]
MLTILVSDWRNREKSSHETIPLADVVRLLGSDWQGITDKTATVEIVDLIHNFLADTGRLREATKTAHQFETREELLLEATLMGVIQDWKAAGCSRYG